MPPASSRARATASGVSCVSRKIEIIGGCVLVVAQHAAPLQPSLPVGSEIQCFHDKFVLAAIQHHLADLADLAFDDGVVLARNHVTREHGAGVSTVPGASCRGPESSCTPMSGA